MQLLTIAIPKLEEMHKDGEDGRKKIAAITRYLTIGLSLIQSTAMAVGFGRQGLLVEFNFVNAAIVVLTLTAGSAFLMWIGERITEKALEMVFPLYLSLTLFLVFQTICIRCLSSSLKGKALHQADLRL